MDNSFFAYLQRLELMAFFSGYAFLYAVVFIILNSYFRKYATRVLSLLPISYGVCGLLYLGLQLRNLYPEVSLAQMKENLYQPFLVIWGLLSTAFLLPALHKRPFLSLLHSLVFFFFIARDLYTHTFKTTNKEVVQNDMKVFTDSLLLNVASFVVVLIIYWFRGAGPRGKT
jgi:hypothetical protein